MFGLALSTKWAVAPFVAVAVGMSFAWEMARASAAERPRRLARTAAVVAIFGFLPLATYVAAEIPWFLDAHRYAPGDCADPDPGDGSRTTLAFRLRDSLAGEFVCYQTQVFRFHRDLEKFEAAGDDDASSSTTGGTTKLKPSHPYFGQAYAWPWIGRPVAHYYEGLGEGKSARASEVLGLPNPAIWWAGFLAVPFLAWLTVVRRDAVASLVIGMVIAGWGPYLFADAVNRPVFLFYATPLVPYLVIGIVHVLVRISSWWRGASWLPAGYAAVAVLTFAYFYPVLAAHPIPREGILGWESHMWYSGPLSDCGVANAIKIFCWI
jgi:dolichyl-phosphate-mannose--protein O-mannosyl transferase